jgi:flagellar protein FliS
MNFHAMMKEYKTIDVQSKVQNENPHEFIKIVLNELLNNMKTLSLALKEGPKVSSVKSRAFSQSLASIMILQSSLDFENGQPIAGNLNDLYSFCRTEIIKSFKEQSTEGLEASISVINDIFEAWILIN